MKILKMEMPKFRKCCFCVPMNYGLLVFGYIKLAAAFAGMVLIQIAIEFVIMETLATVLIVVDIGFSIVLIIAAHKENSKLLSVYYYYGITETIISLLSTTLLIAVGASWTSSHDQRKHMAGVTLLIASAIIFVHIVIEVYIILLVKSEKENHKESTESTISTAEAGRGSSLTADRPRMSDRDSKY